MVGRIPKYKSIMYWNATNLYWISLSTEKAYSQYWNKRLLKQHHKKQVENTKVFKFSRRSIFTLFPSNNHAVRCFVRRLRRFERNYSSLWTENLERGWVMYKAWGSSRVRIGVTSGLAVSHCLNKYCVLWVFYWVIFMTRPKGKTDLVLSCVRNLSVL